MLPTGAVCKSYQPPSTKCTSQHCSCLCRGRFHEARCQVLASRALMEIEISFYPSSCLPIRLLVDIVSHLVYGPIICFFLVPCKALHAQTTVHVAFSPRGTFAIARPGASRACGRPFVVRFVKRSPVLARSVVWRGLTWCLAVLLPIRTHCGVVTLRSRRVFDEGRRRSRRFCFSSALSTPAEIGVDPDSASVRRIHRQVCSRLFRSTRHSCSLEHARTSRDIGVVTCPLAYCTNRADKSIAPPRAEVRVVPMRTGSGRAFRCT